MSHFQESASRPVKLYFYNKEYKKNLTNITKKV